MACHDAGPALSTFLCCLEVLSDFGTSGPRFHFVLNSVSSVLSPAPEPRNPLQGLKEQGAVKIQRRVGERKGGPDEEGLRSSLEALAGRCLGAGEPDNLVRQEGRPGTQGQKLQSLGHAGPGCMVPSFLGWPGGGRQLDPV